MSGVLGGALATFNIGLEAVSAIDTLEFGAAGDVVLGDFQFYGFEVPSHVKGGGKQAMTVHTLPGGERVFDLLGPDESSLEWSGAFLGDLGRDPNLAVRQLDQMRADGQALPLVWGQYFYTVLIDSFEFESRTSGPLAYRISCKVVRNEATLPPGFVAPINLTSTIVGDINFARAAVAVL